MLRWAERYRGEGEWEGGAPPPCPFLAKLKQPFAIGLPFLGNRRSWREEEKKKGEKLSG